MEAVDQRSAATLYRRGTAFYVGRAMNHLPAKTLVIARADDLPPGTTKKFMFMINGNDEECFLVNHRGELFAYVNRCCHVPMSLDWVENQFFTEDKQFLQCATHGAHYLPDTGECVSGPPCGKFLQRVSIRREGEEIIAIAPGAEDAA